MWIRVVYFVAYDRLKEYVNGCVKEERFIESVVMIHTSIEIYLSSILQDTVNDDEKQKALSHLRFIDLARFCYVLDQIDRITYSKLLELNKYRNYFAHQDFHKVTVQEFTNKTKEWLDLANYISKIGIKVHEEWQDKHHELKDFL